MPKIRIYGDISTKHEADFLFIKGFFGAKNNGEALEKMIDRVLPEVKKEIAKKEC